jgi:ligand-binding sensor domain-containing protein
MKLKSVFSSPRFLCGQSGNIRCAGFAATLLLVSSCQGQPNMAANATTVIAQFSAQPPERPKGVINWSGNALLLKPYMPETDITLQVSQYIRRLFQDSYGFIWFGTQGDGACRFNGKDMVYFKKAQGLAGNVVRGMLQDDAGNMWFATEQGVSRYNKKLATAPCNLGTCAHRPEIEADKEAHDTELKKSFSNFSVKDGLLHNDTWSIAKDSKGNIWLGTMAGVTLFDGKTFEAFPLPAADVQPNARFNPGLVWSIFEDRQGNTWFATDGAGLRKYDGKTITMYTTKDGLADNNVASILQDRTGALWFGTRFGGVSRFENGKFTNFSVNEGLSNAFVNPMLQDKNGMIWMGTSGGGICRINPKTIGKDPAAIEHFGAASGLFNQHVQSILQDKAGKLWIGTSGGVYQFDGKRFINFRRTGC